MKKRKGKHSTPAQRDHRPITELRESFSACDANADGRIQFAEFVTLLDNLEAHVSPQEAKLGFAELDTDDDHLIDFAEFVAWWNDR